MFAGDEHGGLGRSDALDVRAQSAHGEAAADHEFIAAGAAVVEVAVYFDELIVDVGFLEEDFDARGVEGLHDVVEGPRAHAGDGALDRAGAGHQYDNRPVG